VDKYCLQQVAPFGLFAYLYDMPRWTFRAHTKNIGHLADSTKNDSNK